MSPARIVVYILRCADGSLYTGAAKDLDRRLAQHAAGRASRYTRSRLPVTLLWSRSERSWGRALQTERWIKQLPRTVKDAIVGGAPLRVRRTAQRSEVRKSTGSIAGSAGGLREGSARGSAK